MYEKGQASIIIIILSSGVVYSALNVATLQKWSVYRCVCQFFLGTAVFFSCKLFKSNGTVMDLDTGTYLFSNFTWLFCLVIISLLYCWQRIRCWRHCHHVNPKFCLPPMIRVCRIQSIISWALWASCMTGNWCSSSVGPSRFQVCAVLPDCLSFNQ